MEETKKNYGKNRRSDFFMQKNKRKNQGNTPERKSRRVEKPYKENNYTDSEEREFSKRNFRNQRFSKDKPFERKRDSKRRSFNEEARPKHIQKGLESDILREIVHRRKSSGRQSERKSKILSLSWNEERDPIRLNKYISNSGICSRREADELILAGAITVNGKIVTELGTKVLPTDEVRYGDKVLQREKPVYILLNKPKNFITTTDDEFDRENVMKLIEGACKERVYPVGRLDRNTTGLLLFTNDGELTKKLTHPQFEVKKIYQVELDKDMSINDFETLKNGIELYDGFIKPDELEFVDGQRNVLGICLHSGKNRIVRRMFGYFGYEVEKLDRTYYAGLTKKDLPRGQYRFLTQMEINSLKMI
ncbi:MAG: rRNA pseudouridine synthase [Bacteroidales bacterium]|nr:rRNA pseudouridine synthase [Bacteroidales bacterium]